jgi:restriction endonuclease S subunit/methylase of polypeptide subunit release factors
MLLSKNNECLMSIIDDDNIKKKCRLLKPEKIEKYKSFIYDIKNLEKEMDIKNVWSNFINDFMAKIFNNIYIQEDANFNTPNEYDIKHLIRIILNFKITDEFINDFFMKNGDIHESFLKYQGKINSKELGQFFTPRIIIKSLLNECGFKDLILNKEGSDFSLCDSCMGTAGLLCYTYNYCKDKINPNKIYGSDIERDTLKFGCASLILATNSYNTNILRCNSLIESPSLFYNEDDKFDIIIINPPFGTKNNYKSLNKLFDNYKNAITTREGFNGNAEIEFKNIYPIVSNVGTVLFIQLVIYQLKENGIACIILPDGELMTSINNINIRKYILDNCKLLKVINISGGLFTNTTIKTKALFIQKCKNNETNDNYNNEVIFQEIKDNGEAVILGEKKLNDKFHFTFDNKEEEKDNYNSDIEIKTLGEVCDMSIKGNINSKEISNSGEYPFYKASVNNPSGTHNTYCFDDYEYILFIKSGGNANNPLSLTHGIGKVYYVNGKSCGNTEVIKIKANSNINLKYLYYYLNINQLNIQKLAKYSTNLGHINMNDFKEIKIPIPSIEKQLEIVEYLDFIYDNVIKKNIEKIEDIKKLNKYYLSLNISFNTELEIKTLGDICDFLPKSKKLASYGTKTGQYPFITSSPEITKYCDKADYINDDYIIIGTGGNANIHFHNNFNCSADCYVLKASKYIYYYLKNNINILENGFKGVAIKHISKDYIKEIKIPIPPIENQLEIVEYLDFNNDLIKTLEKENEINKKNTEQLLKNVLYKD